jgi:hypothetical protein
MRTVQITSCPECGWRLESILPGDGMTLATLTHCPSIRAEGPCLAGLVTEHIAHQDSGGNVAPSGEVVNLGPIDLGT